MKDKWEIFVVAKDNEQDLGSFDALRRDDMSGYMDCIDFLEIQGDCYTGTADIGYFHVYKNSAHYATIEPSFPMRVIAGQWQDGNLVVYQTHLVKAKPAPVCTCGAWVTYGRDSDLHADNIANTCDLRKK